MFRWMYSRQSRISNRPSPHPEVTTSGPGEYAMTSSHRSSNDRTIRPGSGTFRVKRWMVVAFNVRGPHLPTRGSPLRHPAEDFAEGLRQPPVAVVPSLVREDASLPEPHRLRRITAFDGPMP